jgi:hypothetical protein
VASVNCLIDNFFSNFRANFFFFFQLSSQKFSGFSTFEPKKIGRKNFRGKKIRAYKLSDRKFLPGKTFRPYGQEQIGRIGFCNPGSLRRDACTKSRFFRFSRRSFQNFLARKSVRAQNILAKCPKKYPSDRELTSRTRPS